LQPVKDSRSEAIGLAGQALPHPFFSELKGILIKKDLTRIPFILEGLKDRKER